MVVIFVYFVIETFVRFVPFFLIKAVVVHVTAAVVVSRCFNFMVIFLPLLLIIFLLVIIFP